MDAHTTRMTQHSASSSTYDSRQRNFTDNDNVLVVTDDCDNAAIVTYGLSQRGLKTTAIAVEDLTRKYVRPAVGVVILDIYDSATAVASLYGELRTLFAGPTLVMCYGNDERFVLSLYRAGIAEFITKPIGMSLLVAKVTAWLRRTSVDMVPRPKERDDFQSDAMRRTVTTPNGNHVRLSTLEYQLFEILHSNRGRVLPTGLLVDRIWGQYEEGDSRLKHVVLRLRRKIEPNPGDPTYIETVDREGYRFRPLG